jgi:hypothetical protein
LDELGRKRVYRLSTVAFSARRRRWEVRLKGIEAPVFFDTKRSVCLTWEAENLASGKLKLLCRKGADSNLFVGRTGKQWDERRKARRFSCGDRFLFKAPKGVVWELL